MDVLIDAKCFPWLTHEPFSINPAEAAKIVCPTCGFDYNHHAGIEMINGQDAYKAWMGRGNVVVIRFDGECGHRWSLRFGFHKGQMYVFWMPEGDVPKDPERLAMCQARKADQLAQARAAGLLKGDA